MVLPYASLMRRDRDKIVSNRAVEKGGYWVDTLFHCRWYGEEVSEGVEGSWVIAVGNISGFDDLLQIFY